MTHGLAPQPLRPAPPGEWKHPPPRAAACVICDCTIEPVYQDSKGPLGFNAYRRRSAEAIGKHGCLVFVAYSLLHLTCLPTVSDRTKGLIHTPVGTPVGNRGVRGFRNCWCVSTTGCPTAPRLTMSSPSYSPSSVV